MKTKNYLLKTLALVLAMIILISNFSFVFASSVTAEDIKNSLRNIFDTKVYVLDSDRSKTIYPAMGDSVLIDDTNIKYVDNNNKEYSYSTYAVEDNKLIFNTDFSDFNTYMIEEYQKNGMEITDEVKESIAIVLQMQYLGNVNLGFLAAVDAVNQDRDNAYTYFQNDLIEKVSNEYYVEGDYVIKNIDVNTDLASLKINTEDKTLTTGVFTVDLDKLEELSGDDVDLNNTIYSVYYNELPDDKKDTIEDFKDWFEVNSKYTYTGKAIKPVVYSGFFLEKDTDYKVTYSNNKNIGKATIKVTGLGDYKDSFTMTFQIVPKGTTISKATKRTTKSFKLKWKKQTTQTKGYQIQYSTNKNFKSGNKIVTITNNKTTSKKITGLKENKNYYVRIRTYKTVNGTKYYSSWSKAKTVRTKSSKEKTVKDYLTNYLKKAYGKNIIKKVAFDSVKIYNKSEIKNDESLKGYKIGSNDIVFDVIYRLKVKANYNKKIELTAATGEIKGNWIINKYNCGILKYKSNSYKVTAFGTGF